jgi:hypothetical protein
MYLRHAHTVIVRYIMWMHNLAACLSVNRSSRYHHLLENQHVLEPAVSGDAHRIQLA